MMFFFLAKRTGKDTTEDHSLSQGRTIISCLWPIFLPILLIMWIQNEIEDSRHNARAEAWRRRARGEIDNEK